MPAELRDELYDQLGLEAELETILHHTYAMKPITALVKGLKFAFGHVFGLRRCARILGTPSVVMKLKAMLLRKQARASEQKEPRPEDYMNLIRSRLTEQYGPDRVATANDNRGARVTILTEGPKDLDIVDMIFQSGNETHMIQIKDSWIQSGENRDSAE